MKERSDVTCTLSHSSNLNPFTLHITSKSNNLLSTSSIEKYITHSKFVILLDKSM